MEKQTLDITAENGRGGKCVQKMLYSDTPLAAAVPLVELTDEGGRQRTAVPN